MNMWKQKTCSIQKCQYYSCSFGRNKKEGLIQFLTIIVWNLLCCIANEETIIPIYKNLDLFFITTKGSKWLHVSETKKPSTTTTDTTLGRILKALLLLVSLMRSLIQNRFPGGEPIPSVSPVYLLAAFRILTVTLLSLDNILNAYTFFFRFPIHVVHLCSALFT